MFIERNGERIVLKPAFVEDLGTPQYAGDRHPLFAAFFTEDGREVKRRVDVPRKQIEPGLFLVKQGDGFAETKDLDDAVWCDEHGAL